MNEFQQSELQLNGPSPDQDLLRFRSGQKYKHSGRAPLFGLVAAAIVGFACAAIGGIGYCYCITKLHLALVEIVLLVGLSLTIGLPIGLIAFKFKIRSDLHLLGLTIAAGTIAIYFEWAFHPYFALGEKHRYIAWAPSDIWFWMKLLFAKGGEFSGWYAVAIWVAEILLVYLLGLGFAIIQIENPFCERCECWTERRDGVAVFAQPQIDHTDAFVRIEDGDFAAFQELQTVSRKAQSYLRVDMDMCPKCLQTCFVSLVSVDHKANDKGELEKNETKFFSQLAIDQDELATIIAAGKVDQFSSRR